MQKIIFHPSSEDHSIIVPSPRPASSYRCDWWSKTEAFYDKSNLYSENYGSNLTIKHCIPFRDSLFAGYIQESWQDIRFNISDEDGTINYVFPSKPDIISHRDHSSIPVGEEFYPIEFVIKVPWVPETPKGWSVLITQPFNRPELPFYAPAGIIDSDHLNNTTGEANFPIYLRKDAPKTILAGTPLYQIIPFKREDWGSEVAAYDPIAQKRLFGNIRKVFWGGYKKFFWQKKTYV